MTTEDKCEVNMTIKRNGPAGVSAPATLTPPERSRGAYLKGKPFTATLQPIYYSIPRRTAAVAVDTLEAIEWHIEMECSTRGLKDSTLARKRSVLGQLAERCPQLPATADDIRAILNQGGKRSSTKKAQLSHLNVFFASIGPRYGVSNPCREIGPIKVRDSRAWALTEEQIDKVLLACRTPLAIVLVVAFLDTGLRLEEMSNLRVNDIRGNWISVPAEAKSGRRDVPLSAELREQMLLLARGEYIWCGTKGPLSYKSIEGRIRRIVKKAGITGPLVGPHLLRHSFATQYLRDGGGLEDLRLILGHKHISETMKYLHLLPADVERGHAVHSPARTLGLLDHLPICRDTAVFPAAARCPACGAVRRAGHTSLGDMTLPAGASRVICESDMTKGLKAVVGANSDEAAEYGQYYRIKPWAERGSTMQQKIRNAVSAFHTWRIEQGEDVGANPWEAPVPDAETLLAYLARVSELSQSWQSWTRIGLRTYLKDRREPGLFRLIGIPLSEIRSRLAECAVEAGGIAVA